MAVIVKANDILSSIPIIIVSGVHRYLPRRGGGAHGEQNGDNKSLHFLAAILLMNGHNTFIL